MYPSFASLNVPYDLVQLMYRKRSASIQFLILRLVIQCTLWSKNIIHLHYLIYSSVFQNAQIAS